MRRTRDLEEISVNNSLSVVFSSFNGEKTLRTMLDGFCRLHPPEASWQLIAVDNASTDSTRSILDAYQDRLPLVIIEENKKGKNNALNKAIDYVVGDLVVFTDDDVVPNENWLIRLQASAKAHEDYDLFGGQILPRWPVVPMPWLMSDLPLGMLYAITDPRWETGEIDVGNIWGPNMAVRKKIFDMGLRFSTGVGPDGSETYMMGSEGDFTRRLGKMDMKAWFCRDAIVEHLIRPNQMTQEWVLNRFFRHGRSSYKYDHLRDSATPRLFGVERWLYRKIVDSLVNIQYQRLRGDVNAVFKAKAAYYHLKGQLYQAKREKAVSV